MKPPYTKDSPPNDSDIERLGMAMRIGLLYILPTYIVCKHSYKIIVVK